MFNYITPLFYNYPAFYKNGPIFYDDPDFFVIMLPTYTYLYVGRVDVFSYI